MHKPIKHRVGVYLLFSIIPALIVFLVTSALYSEGIPPAPLWYIPGGLSMIYLPVGLTVGLVLFLWGNTEFKRVHQAAQRYAELNGWHPVSRTSWRNRKRQNVALSVSQAFAKQTYILTVDVDDETTIIDEFETPLWSLQFGDWLWEHLLRDNTSPDIEEVAEQRAQWEITALAIRPPTASSPTNPQREYHAPSPPRPDIRVNDAYSPSPKSRVTAGLLAMLLGWLGVHKFYLGHKGLGVLYIAGTFTFFFLITFVVSIVEGIMYLTKSDEEFQYIYIEERKAMF